MDLFSHALLPYLLGKIFKRNKEEITAFVLGGIAPDFDFLILWIDFIYPTFFLITHRGITHSLFFGFFTSLTVLYIASRPKISTKVRRFIDFKPVLKLRTIAFACAGVMIHLFLDYVTTRGVSLLYPFDVARYSAEVFFFIDTYLTILSLIMIIYLYKRPFQQDINKKFLIIFLIVFAGLGAIRMAEKNSAESFFQGKDIKAYPTMSPFDWYVLSGDEKIIRIYEYNGLDRTSPYNETVSRVNILSTGENLNAALGAAGELPQIKMFKWRAYTVSINAFFSNGVWFLEYYDPLQRVTIRGAPSIFRKGSANWSSIKVRVEAGKAVIL